LPGLDALDTGIRMLPVSIAMLSFCQVASVAADQIGSCANQRGARRTDETES
jgi:hypothetical protein